MSLERLTTEENRQPETCFKDSGQEASELQRIKRELGLPPDSPLCIVNGRVVQDEDRKKGWQPKPWAV